MALREGDIANYETLIKAAKNGELALIETTDAKTGEYRAVLAAVAWDGKEYVVTPFGHLATGNPYQDYTEQQSWGRIPLARLLPCRYQAEGLNSCQ